MTAQARPDGAIGGRRQGTDARGRTGVSLLLETETTGEAGGTEIGRPMAPGGIAEKESGANERLDRRERT